VLRYQRYTNPISIPDCSVSLGFKFADDFRFSASIHRNYNNESAFTNATTPFLPSSTRNEQIIRCHLIKSKNRSSLKPYPTANSTNNINFNTTSSNPAGLIKSGSCSRRIYFNEPDLIADTNASVTAAASVADVALSFTTHHYSPSPSAIPQSVYQDDEVQNEIFFRNSHFSNECVPENHFQCLHSPSCNNSTSCLNAFPAYISPPPSSPSSASCSKSNCDCGKNACLFCLCCSAPAVSPTDANPMVGYHADNPFVDEEGVMMEEEEYHHQQENGHDYYFDDSMSGTRSCSRGGPMLLRR